jgi:uncharacterized protein
MRASLRIPISIFLIIVIAIIIFILRQVDGPRRLAAMIRDDDAGGVSRLIASSPKIVNVAIDSRTKLSPLSLAAGFGRETICSNLIAAGADVNSRDVVGETPMFAACRCLNTNIISMLLQHGADVSLTNIIGDTPLSYVTGLGDTNVVLLLLQHGADPVLYR